MYLFCVVRLRAHVYLRSAASLCPLFPPACLLVSMSLSLSLSVCLYVSLSVCLSVCVSLSVSVCFCLFLSVSVCFCLSLSVCLCLHLSLSLSLSLFLCLLRLCFALVFFSFPSPLPLRRLSHQVQRPHRPKRRLLRDQARGRQGAARVEGRGGGESGGDGGARARLLLRGRDRPLRPRDNDPGKNPDRVVLRFAWSSKSRIPRFLPLQRLISLLLAVSRHSIVMFLFGVSIFVLHFANWLAYRLTIRCLRLSRLCTPPHLQLVKGFPAEAVGHGGALVLIQLSMSLWASYPSDPLVVEVSRTRRRTDTATESRVRETAAPSEESLRGPGCSNRAVCRCPPLFIVASPLDTISRAAGYAPSRSEPDRIAPVVKFILQETNLLP